MKQIANLIMLLATAISGVVGCDRRTPSGGGESTSIAPSGAASIVPDAVQLTITCRESAIPESPRQFKVTDSTVRSRFVSALRKIDWSQKGVRLAEAADMRVSDVELLLIDASGASHRYAFFWSGDVFLDPDSGRALTADVSRLRTLVSEVAGLTN